MLVNAPGVLGFRNVAAPTRLVAPPALYLHAKKHAGAGLFHDFLAGYRTTQKSIVFLKDIERRAERCWKSIRIP